MAHLAPSLDSKPWDCKTSAELNSYQYVARLCIRVWLFLNKSWRIHEQTVQLGIFSKMCHFYSVKKWCLKMSISVGRYLYKNPEKKYFQAKIVFFYFSLKTFVWIIEMHPLHRLAKISLVSPLSYRVIKV